MQTIKKQTQTHKCTPKQKQRESKNNKKIQKITQKTKQKTSQNNENKTKQQNRTTKDPQNKKYQQIISKYSQNQPKTCKKHHKN